MKTDRILAAAALYLGVWVLFSDTPAQAEVEKGSLAALPLEMLIQKAKSGNKFAQSKLGSVYFNGELGAEKDPKKAAHWFGKSAKQGFVNGEFNLGICYEQGMGIDKDLGKALLWYRKAADKGLIQAQINAALLLEQQNDFVTAAKYLEMGANAGDIYCCREYGRRLMRSEHIPLDGPKAVSYLGHAAAASDAEALILLADCYAGQVMGVEPNLEKMIDCLWKAAGDGAAAAESKIGFCYEEGLGVPKNTEMAVQWYRRAAKQGNPDAMINLAHCYLYGRGVGQDEKAAFMWYDKAAQLKSPVGLYNAGVCYAAGRGTKRADRQAAEYFQQAAELGNAKAQYNLGLFYEDGRGVEANSELAYYWYKQGAAQNDSRSLTALAFCCLKGIGTDKNKTRAKAYLEQAAALDDDEAKKLLKTLSLP